MLKSAPEVEVQERNYLQATENWKLEETLQCCKHHMPELVFYREWW